MYRIHNLYSILLVSYINLPSLSSFSLSLGHLLVDPVRLSLLPLLFHLITYRYELIVIFELCLKVNVAYVLIELLGFLSLMQLNGGEPLVVVALVDYFLVVIG